MSDIFFRELGMPEEINRKLTDAISDLLFVTEESTRNTPKLKVEMGDVFLKALKVYEEKNVKFADAVMGYWGLEKGISIAYSYDGKDFRRIEGLTVKKP